ncbi:MAG: [Clostridia bacterium]|nr:[FeFe] hydrogenase H-cluster radical SAM maturase HydE [Clostridia bacterium]
MKRLVDKLKNTQSLSKAEWVSMIDGRTPEIAEYLFKQAREVREKYYGKDIYIRGLIEFTSYCKNDCLYCGLRKSNCRAERYRLDKETVLACCENGYSLGFRTFVLQGGEDGYFNEERLCDLISSIKSKYPDCALTLSVGEKTYNEYLKFYESGADRYLLRHETFDGQHYAKLHPESLSAEKRQECLWNLKKIGYQVGSGFMVGSPGQSAEHLAEDMMFLKKLNPQMVGIGPFIPQQNTPFGGEKAGTAELTLYMIGLLRLMLPKVLLPATTALGTVDSEGREKGILAGANVIMPNLSPKEVRGKYLLYDNKLCTGDEAAENLKKLKLKMESIGFRIVEAKGDSLNIEHSFNKGDNENV